MKKILCLLLSLFVVFTSTATINAGAMPPIEITNINSDKKYNIGDTLEFSVKTAVKPDIYNELVTISSNEIGKIEIETAEGWKELTGTQLLKEPVHSDSEYKFRITLSKTGTYTIDAKLDPVVPPKSPIILTDSKTINVIDAVASIEDSDTHTVNYHETLNDAFNSVNDSSTITLLKDVTLSEPLNIVDAKTTILDLGGKTVTGRINLHKGNLTIKNGAINGGDKQALNVYGSSSNETRYSVLTIDSDVNVTADVYGVCLFGETASSANGYGAVIDIYGDIKTTGDGKNGAIFVSGNLGMNVSGNQNNIINIKEGSEIKSETDAALALNGNATVNIEAGTKITGNTALAVKRGTLNVEGGEITATGNLNEPSTPYYNGTEMTGAAVSVTETYSKYGPLEVNIAGGDFVAQKGHAIFMNNATYASDAIITISNGTFSDLSGLQYIGDKKTYTLNSDVTLTKTVESSNSALLNLNGHNITADGVRAIHVKDGLLQIRGAGTISASGEALNKDSSVIRVGDNEGSNVGLTVGENVVISSDKCYGITYFGTDNQVVTIDGKVEVTGKNPAISGNGNSTNGKADVTVNGLVSATQDNAIYNPQSGTLKINGTVKGGIEVKAGTTEVAVGSTAKIEARNVATERNTNNNGCSTKGYAIAAVNNKGYKGNAKVEIKGGFISGPIAVLDDNDTSADKKCSIVITGGDFTVDFDEEYVAQGYKKAPSTVTGCLKTVEKVTEKSAHILEETLKNVDENIDPEDKSIIESVMGKVETEDLVESVKANELDNIINAVLDTPDLSSLTEFNVDVFVEVEAKQASLSETANENKTITFKVTPFVVVRGVGENYLKMSNPIKIENYQLAPDAKIKVTLPTCDITPKEVIHIRDNGSKEYFFSEGSKTFVDNGDGTITIEISDFSEIKINAKVTYVAPKQNDHGKKKTYKAPSTGIE